MSFKKINIPDISFVDEYGNGPGMWNKVLAEVQDKIPEATPVVAGGAVRDFILGYAPKDIDVFLTDSTADYPLELEVGMSRLFPSQKPLVQDAGDPLNEFLPVANSLSSGTASDFFGKEYRETGLTKYPVQVIIGKDDEPAVDVATLLDRFDYGLVKAAYSIGDDNIIINPLFERMQKDPNKVAGISKLDARARARAHTRYRKFRERTHFGLRVPTEWFSTEDFVKGQQPDWQSYDAKEWATEISQRSSSNVGTIVSIPFAKKYYYHRAGTNGDIMKYRFVDNVLAKGHI